MYKKSCFRSTILILLIVAVTVFPQDIFASAPVLTITAIDYGSNRVAGGDAVLLSSSGEYLLMDTTNNDDTNALIRYLKSHRIKQLSLYLSHWHEDHFFYLWKIMDDPYFTVKHLYLPKTDSVKKCAGRKYRYRVWYESARRCWSGLPNAGLYGAKQVREKAKKEHIPVTYLKKGSSFQIGNATAEVLWSGCSCSLSKGFMQYINDRSLVTKVTAGDQSFLTAGDITEEVFRRMKKKGIDLRADVYKLSHHGNSDTEATIRRIRPTYAFYCDGNEKSGQFRLTARRKKIARLTKLYSVRRSGTIKFRLYGKTAKVPVRVTAKKGLI